MAQRTSVCPVCGESARTSRQWVLNKYGKRYDYLIWHHKGVLHYSNKNKSGYIRKHEIENALIEIINSQQFRMGAFSTGDLKKILSSNYPDISYDTIKMSLNRLADAGMVRKHRNGRNVQWVNTTSDGRLSYLIASLSITLEDTGKNGLYERHTYLYKIKNDRSSPLYYMPFRVVGDVDIALRDLSLKASSSSGELAVAPVDDTPRYKRFLLKLPHPLPPGGTEDVRIEYNLPEPAGIFSYSSATRTDNFTFAVYGNRKLLLKASLTSGTREDIMNLSGRIVVTSSPSWNRIYTLTASDIEAFSVLQFTWNP